LPFHRPTRTIRPRMHDELGVMAAVLPKLASEAGQSSPRRAMMALDAPCRPGRCSRKCPGSSRQRAGVAIDASVAAIGVPFSAAIVASEVGSCTPALGRWRAFYDTTRGDRERHVYVAQSHFHDIVAAYELGICSVWINRLGERAQRTPIPELPDLHGLDDVLAELVS
jgi:hypothetical protein